jgi:hypothetical protein
MRWEWEGGAVVTGPPDNDDQLGAAPEAEGKQS